ncbi:hypothetical protein GW835_02055 [archaeon]|jgi:hypothetical protein|nr:hypothetical protein [archaeon]NCP79329.1 hypothetical protein [archaeon]NCP97272.1 hypothetical protein [archaeon]NCQ07096.1 hypothetical protein [archaeon]NCQ50892.1 hypothetical protein [archaeon]
MVHKCIKCNKIIDSTRIYCKACEANIRKKDEIKRLKENQWNKADFFERQRMK